MDAMISLFCIMLSYRHVPKFPYGLFCDEIDSIFVSTHFSLRCSPSGMYEKSSDILEKSSLRRGSIICASLSTSSVLANAVTFKGLPYVRTDVLLYLKKSPYSIPAGTIYTGLLSPNFAFAANAALNMPLPRGRRDFSGRCRPSGNMQNLTSFSRVATMISCVSTFFRTFLRPSL